MTWNKWINDIGVNHDWGQVLPGQGWMPEAGGQQ